MSSKASGGSETVCPRFHAAVELVGRRWSGAILCVLTDSDRRFADITRAVPGLSDRLLSTRLRELEGEGLVERVVEDDIPVRVTYRLTSKGRDLQPAIEALRSWAERWVNPPDGEVVAASVEAPGTGSSSSEVPAPVNSSLL